MVTVWKLMDARDGINQSAGITTKRLRKSLDPLHVRVLMVYHKLIAVFLIAEQPLVLLIVELVARISVTVRAIMDTEELDAGIGQEI